MILPNSPEALLIAKKIGKTDRAKVSTKCVPVAGKQGRIPNDKRKAMFKAWQDGKEPDEIAEIFNYNPATIQRIIKEEREKMTTKEKAPAAVEEPTSAVVKNHNEYTTLDTIRKEMTEKQARIEIVNAAVKAVIDLLKVPASSALFDYKAQDDGQYGYVMRYPVDTVGILVEICNAIKGVAE